MHLIKKALPLIAAMTAFLLLASITVYTAHAGDDTQAGTLSADELAEKMKEVDDFYKQRNTDIIKFRIEFKQTLVNSSKLDVESLKKAINSFFEAVNSKESEYKPSSYNINDMTNAPPGAFGITIDIFYDAFKFEKYIYMNTGSKVYIVDGEDKPPIEIPLNKN